MSTVDPLSAYRELPDRPERSVRNVWPASLGDVRALRALTFNLVPPWVTCAVDRTEFTGPACPTCGIPNRLMED